MNAPDCPETSPEASQTASAAGMDADVISDMYRALLDQDAFDDMIRSWSSKLDQIERQRPPLAAGPGIGRTGKDVENRHLLRHISSLSDVLDRLQIPADNDPLSRHVSEISAPAIIVDSSLRVAAANETGLAAFGARTGALFDRTRIDPVSRAAFDRLLAGSQNKDNAGYAILRIEIDVAEGGARRAIHAEAVIDPALRHGDGAGYLSIRSLEVGWGPDVSAALSDAFDLTAAEVEICRLFFRHCALEPLARERGVSLHTVRTQFKSILSKTGASSQVELLRLLGFVAGRQATRRPRGIARWRDPLGREKLIAAPNGRQIAWTWMGDPNGRPVLFLRGLGMGYLMPDEAEPKLRKAGLRLLMLSRPGYGNSSLHPDLDVVSDNLACLGAFLDQLEIESCVGVGLSDGLLPLLAQAVETPGRFSALMGAGYTGVLDRAAMWRQAMTQRTMYRLAMRAPRVLDTVARIGHRMMMQHGVEWYLHKAYAESPLDLQTCQSARSGPFVRAAAAHLLAQGHRPFSRELQLFCAPLDDCLDRLSVPLHLLLPTQDTAWEGNAYADLPRRNPLIEVEPVEGAADLLLYQRTELLIDRIIALAER